MMSCARHVAGIGEERCAYRTSVGKPEAIKEHFKDLSIDSMIIL
jgi:hypothetical protein